jgi:hypothetical protein
MRKHAPPTAAGQGALLVTLLLQLLQLQCLVLQQ